MDYWLLLRTTACSLLSIHIIYGFMVDIIQFEFTTTSCESCLKSDLMLLHHSYILHLGDN